MSLEQHDSSLTSNDLLRHLIAKHAHVRRNNPNVGQSAANVEIIETAPPVTGRGSQRDP